MKEINIGILGLGTVGTGIAKIVYDNGPLITSRLGAKLTLKKAADIDLQKDRGIEFDKGVLTADPFEVVNDPEINIQWQVADPILSAKDVQLPCIKDAEINFRY